MPCAARIEAAIPARAPLSQIVTTGRSVGSSAPHASSMPVRDVAAARDVAAVALVALAHVDQLRARLEQLLELVELDRLDPLGPGAEDVAQDVEEADRLETSDRRWASGAVEACTTTRSSASRTKPALVPNEVPETGTLNAPCWWPAR